MMGEAITQAALANPDNPPLTDEQMDNMRPMRGVHPQLFKTKKTALSIRLGNAVLKTIVRRGIRAPG